MNSQAHSNVKQLWIQKFGEDIYQPFFLDISDEDNGYTAMKIIECGKQLAIFMEESLEEDKNLGKAIVNAATKFIIEKKSLIREMDNVYLITRSLVHMRIFGVFLEKTKLDFYDPCLINIPRGSIVLAEDITSIQIKMQELYDSIKPWCNEYILPELEKLEKVKCNRCRNGKVNITVSTFGSSKPPRVTEIDCSECEATGFVNQKTHEFQVKENNIWCECEEEHDTDFYDDDEHEELNKHHWRCSECGKVTQIG